MDRGHHFILVTGNLGTTLDFIRVASKRKYVPTIFVASKTKFHPNNTWRPYQSGVKAANVALALTFPLHELFLTPSKMSHHSEPWLMCEWTRMNNSKTSPALWSLFHHLTWIMQTCAFDWFVCDLCQIKLKSLKLSLRNVTLPFSFNHYTLFSLVFHSSFKA